ncbi:hypothetical protein E3E23_00790 [Thermococcus sp. CX2]|uniref:hypothetical protein n=1 Tax=Thermococcus sp. CX2 TaxID=163006 RepID=UPI0014392AA9|nr:hypothetical protein [Thermococcus sp. CX2]NJE84383.1 hypothetical protein [Thermococcus sp. CX2]
MLDDILERELHNISMKIDAINPNYEILFALLSASLSLLTSYYGGLANMLNLWGLSFGAMFGLWVIWSSIVPRQHTEKDGETTDTSKLPKQLVEYYGEVFGKFVYSGVHSFGILSIISVGVYLLLYSTHNVKENLWHPLLIAFLVELALMGLVVNEDRAIKIFVWAYNLKHGLEGETDMSIVRLIVGAISGLILFSGSIWATWKVCYLLYLGVKGVQEISVHVLALFLFLQYILVWVLMSAINKNQVHRELTNAIICLQNLQYKFSSSEEIPIDKIASCVKYTHFLKLTPLRILELYFYLPHPLYKQVLKESGETSKKE